ncbi:hypothetical protein [Brevundimonas sp.]|uniref:hypothetical protein n=1 Tax=Brevundimonas sp. TaxID=1871086 RepID=UPI0028A15B66|nr:hypothetical protein [Brevundimonas sp.]
MTSISVRPALNAARNDMGAAGHCLTVSDAFEGRDVTRSVRALIDAEAVLTRAVMRIREARATLRTFNGASNA